MSSPLSQEWSGADSVCPEQVTALSEHLFLPQQASLTCLPGLVKTASESLTSGEGIVHMRPACQLGKHPGWVSVSPTSHQTGDTY